MKSLKLCLLAAVLIIVESAQVAAQVKVRTALKQIPATEELKEDTKKPAGRTITWFSQQEQEKEVLDLESPAFPKEFNRMIEEMDRMYHGPRALPEQPSPELGIIEGNSLKTLQLRGAF